MPILTSQDTNESKKHWLLVGAFLLLVILGAKVDLDFGELVSFTLQTLFLGLAYFYLPLKHRLVLIATYLTLGNIGLPVFNGGAGLAYVLSYPLGFFVGFVVSAFVPSPKTMGFNTVFMYLLVFHIVILSLGVLWLAYYVDLNSAAENAQGLSIGMVIKSAVGAGVVMGVGEKKQK